MAKMEYKQIALSRKSLLEAFQRKRGPDAAEIIAPATALILLALGLKNPESLLICILLSVCCVAGCVFLLSVRRREKKNNASCLEAIRNGQMFLVKNRVTDKETQNTSTAEMINAASYFLFFHRTSKEGRRRFEVDRQEYLCAAEGDEYYLLYLNERLVRVFPCYKYRLEEDLKPYLVKDKESIGWPQMSEYEQYRKLEREMGVLAKRKWLKTHKSLPRPDGENRS